MAGKMNLGELHLGLSADTIGFGRQMDKAISKLQSFNSAVQKMASVASKAFAGIGLAGGYMVKVASDSRELQNVVNKSFGDMAGEINEWAKTTRKAMNRSTYQMTEFAGTAQAMLKPMLKDSKVAAQMSKAITKLSVDFGSFRNISDERSFEAITAALLGEAESLKRLGYNLQETALDQYLLDKQVGKTSQQLSNSEKVMYRYNYLMELMSDIHGDAIDTAGELENQTKGLFARLREISEQFGNKLYPYVNKTVTAMNKLLDVFIDLDEKTKNQIFRFATITTVILGGAVALGVLATAVSVVISAFGILGTIATTLIPVALIGAGIAVVGGLIYQAWDANWLGIRDKITGFADSAVEKFEAVKSWWQTSDLKSTVEGAINNMKTAISEAFSNISSIVVGGFNEIKDVWNNTDLSLGEKVLNTVEIVAKNIALTGIELVKLSVKGVINFSNIVVEGLKAFRDKILKPLDEGIEQWRNSKLTGSDLSGFFDSELGSLMMDLGKSMGNVLKESFLTVFSLLDILLDVLAGVVVGVATSAKNLGIQLASYISEGLAEKLSQFNPLGWLQGLVGGKKSKNMQVLEQFRNDPKSLYVGDTTMSNADEEFSLFKWLGGKHDGGLIPGVSGKDQFLAMLAPGEAVVPSVAMRKGAPGIMSWFSKMGVPGFQDGGNVIPSMVQGGSTVSGVSGYLASISQSLSKAGEVIVKSFSLIGQLIVEVAKKIFGEENVQGIIDTFEKVKDIFKDVNTTSDSTKPQPVELDTKSIDKMSQVFSSVSKTTGSVLKGLGSNVISSSPVASSVMQGFESGGIAGAIVGLLSNSETFATLMENLNPILQSFADAAGLLLEPLLPIANILGKVLAPAFNVLGTILQTLLIPVMCPVFEVLKVIGIAIGLVAAAFYGLLGSTQFLISGYFKMLNKIFDLLPGFKKLEEKTAELADIYDKKSQDSFKKAGDTLKDTADLASMSFNDAMDDAKKFGTEAKKASEGLKNVPSGVKIALSRFRTAQGVTNTGISTTQTQGSTAGFEGNNVMNQVSNDGVTININRPVYGVEDLRSVVKDTMNEYLTNKKLITSG